METKRPLTLIVAGILLVLLMLGKTGISLWQRYLSPVPALEQRPGLSQRLPEWRQPPERNERQFQNLPNFPARQMPVAFVLMRFIRLIGLWWNLALLALAILAAVGLWKGKGWGATLALVLAALVLIGALSGMFPLRSFGPLAMTWRMTRLVWSLATFALRAVEIVFALAVIVLLLLPVSRRAYRSAASG